MIAGVPGGESMADIAAVKYRAFLSYSHRDKSWAKWLHAALESYRIDKDLVGRETHAGPVPKTLRPIFRDRDDFSAGHSLTAQTLTALEASEFLIVLCSPDAARSKYVNEEIRRFKALGRPEQVIPVIVDGKPGVAERECFPPALRYRVDADGALVGEPEEPLAADVRPQGDGKELACQKVVAALLRLRLDEIVRRAERTRKRRNRVWASLVGVMLLLAVAAGGSAVYAWQQLKTNEAFLNATLKRASEIVNAAVAQAEKYNVPRTATLELLAKAEGLFDDMARLGRPTLELKLRKAQMLLEFARNYELLGKAELRLSRAEAGHQLIREAAREQPDNIEIQQALWKSGTELGEALASQGDLKRALDLHVEALSAMKAFTIDVPAHALKDVPGAFPASLAWQYFSMSMQNVAEVLTGLGDLTQAAEVQRANLNVAWRLFTENPGNPHYLNNLAIAQGRVGQGLVALDKRAEALEAYREQVNIYRRLTRGHPNNADWARNLSVAINRAGDALVALGRLSEALEQYRASLEIVVHLSNLDGSNAVWQNDVASTYGLIGSVHIAQGRPDEAIASYQAQLAISERLVATDPRNAQAQVGLAVVHGHIGDVHISQGNFDDGIAHYRSSHLIWEQVTSGNGGNMAWHMDLMWSHARLAVLGDRQVERLRYVATTLKSLKESNRLSSLEVLWVPFAEQALGAVDPSNKDWQWDLLTLYWRSAQVDYNPVRQATLAVAIARKLRDEKRLTGAQVAWLSTAETELAKLRRTAARIGPAGSP
jgi:tetratricopeptide (TPR) repeat protein